MSDFTQITEAFRKAAEYPEPNCFTYGLHATEEMKAEAMRRFKLQPVNAQELGRLLAEAWLESND